MSQAKPGQTGMLYQPKNISMIFVIFHSFAKPDQSKLVNFTNPKICGWFTCKNQVRNISTDIGIRARVSWIENEVSEV